tara:strand:+ start:3566 stop:3826 length:261 start_codon:yes stop_codon:yes gene_type:complete
MTWKEIIKQTDDTADVASDVGEEATAFDATQTRASAGKMGRGQYKEIADQIAGLAVQARTDTVNQKNLLGNIRWLIKQAGIPEVPL